MILLDTQALIWLIEADPKLGGRARTLIDAERIDGVVMIASISAWETAMLVDKGKLGLSHPVGLWFDLVLSAPGFRLVELTTAIAVDAGTLPGSIHGDPGDRIIVATARALSCPLMTADRKILDYAAAGHLQAIDARR